MRLALVLASLLAVTACTRDADTAADTAATPPPAEATTAPATPSTPADLPPGSLGPVADLTGLEAGKQYVEIPGGQPFAPLDDKVEVVEVFNYVCPACAAFQPLVNSWKPTLGSDVRFVYVPAAFGGNWDPYVRAYYTAEALGVAEKAHDAAFNAIHVERSLQGERGKDTPEQIAAFYAKHGADAATFASTMASFAIDAKFNRAKQFIARNQVNSTPTMIVDGRYKAAGESFEEILANTKLLVERARAARQAASAAPAAEAPAADPAAPTAAPAA